MIDDLPDDELDALLEDCARGQLAALLTLLDQTVADRQVRYVGRATTAAAYHAIEYGHRLSFGCCRDGEQAQEQH